MFIAVDLKVIEGLAAAVGRASGMSEDAVLAGLVRMWHRCWADEVDLFSGDEIAGMFSFDMARPDGGPRAFGALSAFGFLEPLGDLTWRVKGAARYLRLKESRRRGANATNAAKAKTARSKSDALERGLSDAQSRSLTESPSHRDLKDVPKPPPKPRKLSAAQEFFAWLTATRAGKTPLTESPISVVVVNTQFGAAINQHGRATCERAYLRFLELSDPGAMDPPWPWQSFLKRLPMLASRPADGAGIHPTSRSL